LIIRNYGRIRKFISGPLDKAIKVLTSKKKDNELIANYIKEYKNLDRTIRQSQVGIIQKDKIVGKGAKAKDVKAISFNLDVMGLLATREGNVVTISLVNQNAYGYVGATFTSPILNSLENGTIQWLNHISIDVAIYNIIPTAFSINSVVFNQANNACNEIIARVTTTGLATKILSPVIVNVNSSNPFNLTLLRGQNYTLTIENASGTQTNQIIETPSLLNASNFSVLINNLPNGATAIIENANTFGLTLQYFIDNITWQTSNIYSGLVAGNYNLYIKDNFGCSVNKSFLIDEFGIQTPYFYISKSNSIL
jgi:hypothetical protein